MRFLTNMISGMIGESTGVNPRKLARLVGRKNLLLAGGAALLGSALQKQSQQGAQGQAAAPRPPGPPPGAPPAGAVPNPMTPAPPSAVAPPNLPPPPGTAAAPAPSSPPPAPPGATAAPPTLPPVPLPEAVAADDAEGAALPADLTYAILRTMVAAAMADGHLAPQEKEAIEGQLGEAGLSDAQRDRVRRDFDRPATAQELAGLAEDPEDRQVLYRFAVLIAHADDNLSPDEREWLDGLASGLELNAETAARCEREVRED